MKYLGREYSDTTNWSVTIREAARHRIGPSWLRNDLDVASALGDLADHFRGTAAERAIADAALDLIEHGDSAERAAVWQLPWELATNAIERLLRLIDHDRARLDEVRGVPNVVWRLLQAFPGDPRAIAVLRSEASAPSADPWIADMASKLHNNVSVFSDEDIRSYLRLYSEPLDDLSEDENWWMLGTVHVSKRHATFRAGFGHPIVSSTKFVIQGFETDDVRGCAIALLSGSKPPAYFAGWVPRPREPEATRWVKALNDAIQRVLPHRTELPQSIQSNETALVFESGSESAPDDPFGLETLRLSESGQLTYERRRHELRSNVVGTVEPDRVRKLVEALRHTSFPAPPQTRFVPGASIVRITTVPSNESVRVDYFAALRMDGYRDVVRELTQLAAGLRDTNSQVLSEWKFSAD